MQTLPRELTFKALTPFSEPRYRILGACLVPAAEKETEQKEDWKEGQKMANTPSLTAVPVPPGGRGSLSSLYCTLKD